MKEDWSLYGLFCHLLIGCFLFSFLFSLFYSVLRLKLGIVFFWVLLIIVFEKVGGKAFIARNIVYMDTKELIQKCQAIAIKEEAEDIVMIMGSMKIKGEKVVANCLVGKVLLTRSINMKGLKAAMQQVWRTVKEV